MGAGSWIFIESMPILHCIQMPAVVWMKEMNSACSRWASVSHKWPQLGSSQVDEPSRLWHWLWNWIGLKSQWSRLTTIGFMQATFGDEHLPSSNSRSCFSLNDRYVVIQFHCVAYRLFFFVSGFFFFFWWLIGIKNCLNNGRASLEASQRESLKSLVDWSIVKPWLSQLLRWLNRNGDFVGPTNWNNTFSCNVFWFYFSFWNDLAWKTPVAAINCFVLFYLFFFVLFCLVLLLLVSSG